MKTYAHSKIIRYEQGLWRNHVSARHLRRIRKAIDQGQYHLTIHAEEEAIEDSLDVEDVERAIRTGSLTRVQRDEPPAPRYTIIGEAMDGKRKVATVGRFTLTGQYRIVTVYEIRDEEE